MSANQRYDLMEHLQDIPLLGRQYVPRFWCAADHTQHIENLMIMKERNPTHPISFRPFGLCKDEEEMLDLKRKLAENKNVELKRQLPDPPKEENKGSHSPNKHPRV